MRQLEEQYVDLDISPPAFNELIFLVHVRFQTYDFRKMNRRSFYPHNQIISSVTATSSQGIIPPSRTGTPTVGMESMPGARADYNETASIPPPPIPTTKMMPMEKSEAIAL